MDAEYGSPPIHVCAILLIFPTIVSQETDTPNHCGAEFSMETKSNPRVVVADRVDGGVFIEFADGKSGLYSSSLLYEILPRAEQVVQTELDE